MYYLKDIILGLRSEYLKNQARLDELKKCLVADSRIVKDFTPRAMLDEDIVRVIVDIEERQNLIRNIMDRVKEKLSLKDNKETSIEVVERNGECLLPVNDYSLAIIEAYKPRLEKAYDAIKRTNTVFNIGEYSRSFEDKNLAISIKINPEYFDYTYMDKATYTSCMYIPKEDVIVLKTNSSILMDEYFCVDVLTKKVPKSIVPIYNQKIINKAIPKNEFFIHTSPSSEEVKLKIKEYDNGYYLRKKY